MLHRHLDRTPEGPIPMPHPPTVPSGQQMPELPAQGSSSILSTPPYGWGPSPQRLAARQVMPRELPTFTGNPEDWPLFISSYHTSSQACGYTDAENLIRLQRCLKGSALDSVRSRLLLPASVPHVIATLQTLYGRPELLIHTLLQKVREVSAPRSDKLETLIGFRMTVQTLCDHLEAGGQMAHLNNPILLFELVEKLPGNLKLDWALHKQRYDAVNLQTFAQYMTTLVSAASQVTLHIDTKQQRVGKQEKGKERSFCDAHVSDEVSNAAVDERYLETEQRRATRPECFVCKQVDHRVKNCPRFVKMALESRWKAVNENSLCRICLGAHGRRPCKIKKLCGIGGCQLKHHPLLHTYSSKPCASQKAVTSEAVTNHHHSKISSLFRIVPVDLYGNNRSVTTFVFLDDGSSMTLVDDIIAKQLGLDGERDPLCLQWTANMIRLEKCSQRVSLEITGSKVEQKYLLSDVRTVSSLNLPRQSIKYNQLSERYPHLKGLPEDYVDAVPQILIGNNNSHLSAMLKIREGRQTDPIAAKIRLGWTIYGAENNERTSSAHSFHICQCNDDRTLHDLVKEYFSIDNMGVALAECPDSDDNRRAGRILRETTKRVGNRFETGLLWKFDTFEFPDSLPMAIRRMQCLERRMEKDSTIGASVKRQMREYSEKGYIRKATAEELKEADPRRTWYLPLGVVLNPKKPEKIRIFCDAAAKVEGVPLNSMLLKGPDLMSSLSTVLFGFRERRVAICADIKEMFHQILIRHEDRHAQKLIWRDRYPEAAVAITKRHYVDDYLDSLDDEDKAVQLALDVKYVHSRVGFHIRNWISNSSNVLRRIGEAKATNPKSLDLDGNGSTERVLGMLWHPKPDFFTFSTTMAGRQHTPPSGKCCEQ
ncbi:uncharacterized protein LOC131679323 [Topomyia yanbarensis]|uniref:uncharacterized protein LOC131679323 n=1 Tax=Topomyia yanbarensis TaxID=2498891 RepID=UPI00273B5B79|nr:uncharacterized protein LOC131679323 [Topomyia yanbarensis]